MVTQRRYSLNRRQFMHGGLSALGGGAAVLALQTLAARSLQEPESRISPVYGSLVATADEATGLPLLKLPRGFRYRSFHWAGEPLDDGAVVPPVHDGMGVISAEGSIVTICRNHELGGVGAPLSAHLESYDPNARGGCTMFKFDVERGEVISGWVALSGTLRNCAGGPTPWGTWLSCEETVEGEGEQVRDTPAGKLSLTKSHGWIFEVSPQSPLRPKPLRAMGRFVHEALAVDPETDIVYETEDRGSAGFYRFLPNERQRLAAGGRLEMMKVIGRDSLRRDVPQRAKFDTSWVAIDDVERPHSPDGPDTLGVFMQGKERGGATFGRLEGCWYGDQAIYLTVTDGGNANAGQIWRYRPDEETIELLFESPSKEVLRNPDNVTVSPRGGLVLCEDSDVAPERILGFSRHGQLFPLAENHVQLGGFRGRTGDFRDSEWTGATFSPDGRWLFANLQSVGVSFAITGPWESGGV